MYAIRSYYAEWEKQLEAYVRSASALSQAEQEKIRTSLEQRYGCTVKLHCSVDPTLIAGLVIKAGDEVIDATVRSKLNRLAEAFVITSYSIHYTKLYETRLTI